MRGSEIGFETLDWVKMMCMRALASDRNLVPFLDAVSLRGQARGGILEMSGAIAFFIAHGIAAETCECYVARGGGCKPATEALSVPCSLYCRSDKCCSAATGNDDHASQIGAFKGIEREES